MGKSYKTTCPSCGNDNFYVTPSNGLSYCFNAACGHWEKDGDIPQTPRKRLRSENLNEIRQFYEQVASYYHNSLDSRAIAFLHQRGFNDETIQKMQLGYIPCGRHPLYKSSIAKEAGLATKAGEAFLGDRIAFPYLVSNNGVTDIRGRAIDPNDELKYKSPFGDVYARGADYPYNYQLSDAPRLIITEGEIKADLATQSGFPTIALPGMSNWRDGFRQKQGQEIIILFDSQEHNNQDVRAAIRKVANRLDDAKVATLPLFGKKKQDIDSFIIDYGTNIFKMVVDSALDFQVWNRLQRF